MDATSGELDPEQGGVHLDVDVLLGAGNTKKPPTENLRTHADRCKERLRPVFLAYSGPDLGLLIRKQVLDDFDTRHPGRGSPTDTLNRMNYGKSRVEVPRGPGEREG